jgi:uncharacterized OB-fold protein
MSATSTTMPAEAIRITTDAWTAPYWEAAKEGRLVAPRCGACGTFRFPPGPFCPACRSQHTEWVALTGPGAVFSYSVVRGLPGQPDLLLLPVVVAFAEAPGVHVVSNLVDADPDEVRIGMPVVVAFTPIADGWQLPIFRVDT